MRAGMLCVVLIGTVWISCLSSNAATPLQPFPLSDVTLSKDTPQAQALALNTEYMLLLSPDRLLWNFRTNAGLPAPGEPYYGGWEGPGIEVRGHFTGHYLTALAMLWKHTGDPEMLARSEYMVAELQLCQRALNESGYLAAFPSAFFDRLEALQPVWVPYYTVHKIMAGMVAQHTLVGSDVALTVAMDMADYFCDRIHSVLQEYGLAHWQQILQVEFGGMNEVLYDLFSLTGIELYAETARLFDKEAVFEPLLQNLDALQGLHANTHLAQVNGFAARYDATGDELARTAVSNFLGLVLRGHSYSTGGSNLHEHWGPPGSLGPAILRFFDGLDTQETCTQYNILRIARTLFRWSGDPALADFYERALLNGILGTQRSRDALSAPAAGAHPHPHAHGHMHGGDMSNEGSGAALLLRSHGHHGHHSDRRLLEHSAQPAAAPGSAAALSDNNAFYPTRPDNYRIASWPGSQPHAHSGQANDNSAGPGVMLYMLPLGSGQTKGQFGGLWPKGWGNPYDTFWCCYGTGIESFTKLADSIFFFRRASGTASAAAGAQPDAAAVVEGEEDVPELFINQLVSCTLSWTELGVTLTMNATFFDADNTANAQLTVSTPADSPTTFTVKFRMPGWTSRADLSVAVNGELWADDAAAQAETASKGAAPAAVGRTAGPFAGHSNASYWTIRREWAADDVVDVQLPMRVRAERINDASERFGGFHSVMMGPLLMAGLTHDSRVIVADPADVQSLLQPVPTDGCLVSLQAASGEPLYLRHDASRLILGPVQHSGHGLDATFRLVAAPEGQGGAWGGAGWECPSGWPEAGAAVLAEAIDGGVVMLEAVSAPGAFIMRDEQSSLHTLTAQEASSAAAPLLLTLSGALPGSEAAPVAKTASEGAQQTGAGQLLGGFQLAAPLAQVPQGARVLHGANRDFLLVPLMNIVEERYTAYFEFIRYDSNDGADAI